MYYDYYQLIQTVQEFQSYIDTHIYPLLFIIIGLSFSFFTIELLRWFKR